MKKYSNEFKVGLFVILCLFGLFYLTYSTGKLNFKKDGFNLYCVFDEIGGLKNKAPVMLNGLEVGKVDDIQISHEDDKTQLLLKLWIESKAKIREKPMVSIKTLGLMGEKYIQITSGAESGFVKADTVLQGEPYTDIDTMISKINSAVDSNKDSINNTVKNFEATSMNFEEFSDDIKRNPWKLLFRTKEIPKEAKEE